MKGRVGFAFLFYFLFFIYFFKYETIVSRNGLSLECLEQDTSTVSLSGAPTHKSRIYFTAEIQKYFFRYLVQMKFVEFAFNIN